MTTVGQEAHRCTTDGCLARAGHRQDRDSAVSRDVPGSRPYGVAQARHRNHVADRETVTDQSQGPQLATLQELARYWAMEYDWRKVKGARINALPNFITEIDGLDIHFIHVRSKHENALPLIVTHGWPGLDHRTAEDRRSIDEPDGTWRDSGGRLRSGDSDRCRVTGCRANRPLRAGNLATSRAPGSC